MTISEVLDDLPLVPLFFGTVVIVFLPVLAGALLGRRFRQERTSSTEASTGTIVGAMLGMLAFLLAFTFGTASSRFDARKQLVLEDVNAIGTTYLRTDFLPDAEREEAQRLLRRYVDLRVDVFEHPETLAQVLEESEAIQDELWAEVARRAGDTDSAVLLSLYAQSLNEVIDSLSKRVTIGLRYRIPESIWLALWFVTTLAMATVGYSFGVSNSRTLVVALMLALAFSSVIVLIAELDRSMGGALSVDQQPMIELQAKLSG